MTALVKFPSKEGCPQGGVVNLFHSQQPKAKTYVIPYKYCLHFPVSLIFFTPNLQKHKEAWIQHEKIATIGAGFIHVAVHFPGGAPPGRGS